jgi:hypothetical protein
MSAEQADTAFCIDTCMSIAARIEFYIDRGEKEENEIV